MSPLKLFNSPKTFMIALTLLAVLILLPVFNPILQPRNHQDPASPKTQTQASTPLDPTTPEVVLSPHNQSSLSDTPDTKLPISINITNGPSITTFDIILQYNFTILHVTNVNTTGVLNTAGSVSLIEECVPELGITIGNCTLPPGYFELVEGLRFFRETTAPTNGPLFSLTFNVTGTGFSTLHLVTPRVATLIGGFPRAFPVIPVDGYFANTNCGPALCTPPTPSFTANPHVTTPLGIVQVVAGNNITSDASTTMVTNQGATIINYHWEWGDQTPNNDTGNPLIIHAFNSSNLGLVLLVTLTVTDNYRTFASSSILLRPVLSWIELNVRANTNPSTTALTGTIVSVNATVTNDSTQQENATIVVSAANQILNTTRITNMAAFGSQSTISTNWNTRGLAPGTYQVTALAVPVNGQNDTTENMAIEQYVLTGADFTVTPDTSNVNMTTATTGTATITLSALNRFNGTITLATSTFPATGLNCILSATSLTLDIITTLQSTQLSCTGSPGTYSVTIATTSGALTHETTITVNVQDFTIAASPATANVGSSANSTVSLSSLNGLAATVSLADTLPTGLSCNAINPTSVSVPPDATASLSCTSTSPGVFQVIITAANGTLTHTTTAVFTYSDFTVIASSATANLGVSATSTITVSSLNGLTANVSLSDIVPTGLSCNSINPTSVSVPPKATANLSCTSNSLGTFQVTITATNGTLTHTTIAVFIYSDFTITASTPTTVVVGTQTAGTITITSINGLTGTVTLSDTVASGLTCNSLSPPSLPLSTSPQTATISCSASTAGSYAVSVRGTLGTLSHMTTMTFTIADFGIAANPSSVSVQTGSTSISTITSSGLNGFTGTVTLGASTSPTIGPACTLNPTSITLSSTTTSGTSGLSCNAATGSYTVTITATSGSLTRTLIVTVIIRDFTIQAAPSSTSVMTGSTSSTTITVRGLNGYTGTATLSVTIAPTTGLTCTLSPTSLQVNTTTTTATSNLSCSGTADSYTVTTTATSNGLTRTASATIVIQDFAIDISTPAAVIAGATTNSTIVVSGLNGLSGTVDLLATVTPSNGLTCSLSPTSLSLSSTASSATSILVCNGSQGSYTVTLTATIGSQSRQTTVNVNVQSGPAQTATILGQSPSLFYGLGIGIVAGLVAGGSLMTLRRRKPPAT